MSAERDLRCELADFTQSALQVVITLINVSPALPPQGISTISVNVNETKLGSYF